MAESLYPMLAVNDALAMVLSEAETLPPEQLLLQDALGKILAADVIAPDALPPFPASVKDGYAVIAADGAGVYPIIGEVTAGRVADFTVRPGTAAYITTGAPMPDGADAVVMVEETENLSANGEQQRVRIKRTVAAGDDVRPVGVDVQQGQTVLEAGTHLGPAEIGLLATVGAAQIQTYPQPRVAVLSTGDELVEPAAIPGPGQIRDSNRAMLLAAVAVEGGEPIDLGISGDSQAQLESSVISGLQQADILLSSGGVSMGDLDLIKPLLEHAGTVHFGRILMKPGKPLTFATAMVEGKKRLVFGLPGNPVSSLVTFYLMAVPAIRKLAGWANPNLPRVHAYVDQKLRLDPERPEYHRATLRWSSEVNDGRGGYVATSTGSQASSRLLSMRSANALLELPQRSGVLAEGDLVSALVIGPIQ